MTSRTKALEWAKVEVAAEEMFTVLGRGELVWARQAWDHLTALGLTVADDELGRHRAAIRLMALAAVYQDFCYHAWKKELRPALGDWAYYLELQPLRIGQLLGVEHNLNGASGDGELLESALAELVRRERPALHSALSKSYGSVSKLFISLWRTREDDGSTGADGNGGGNGRRATDDEILNDLSFEKIDAYEFVSKGFPLRARKRPAARAEIDLEALGLLS